MPESECFELVSSCQDFKRELKELVDFYLKLEILDFDCIISVLDEVKAGVFTCRSISHYVSSLERRDEE